MRKRYAELAPREQQLLIVGMIFVVFFVCYSMLWVPQTQKRIRLQAVVDEQHALRDWMLQTKDDIERLRQKSSTKVTGTSIFTFVEQAAVKANLGDAIQQIEPQGKHKIRLQLRAANFQKTLVWLRMMQAKDIAVERITIDKTEQAGIVDIRVTLSQGDV